MKQNGRNKAFLLKPFLNVQPFSWVTYRDGPGGFVVAVAHASGFGQLYLMAVDPTPQLMGQPANQGYTTGVNAQHNP